MHGGSGVVICGANTFNVEVGKVLPNDGVVECIDREQRQQGGEAECIAC